MTYKEYVQAVRADAVDLMDDFANPGLYTNCDSAFDAFIEACDTCNTGYGISSWRHLRDVIWTDEWNAMVDYYRNDLCTDLDLNDPEECDAALRDYILYVELYGELSDEFMSRWHALAPDDDSVYLPF